MKNVPHWQWLMVIYFILVAVPVWMVHAAMKQRLLTSKTGLNLLLYFVCVLGVAFMMHFITMWLYFTFIFRA